MSESYQIVLPPVRAYAPGSQADRRLAGEGWLTHPAAARTPRNRQYASTSDRRHGPRHHRGRAQVERAVDRRAQARARSPTATSSTTAPRKDAWSSRNARSSSTSLGFAAAIPERASRPKSRSPPTRRCGATAGSPSGCSRSLSPGSDAPFEQVLPEMDATVGVSKNQVLRETIEAGERLLADLGTHNSRRRRPNSLAKLGPYNTLTGLSASLMFEM